MGYEFIVSANESSSVKPLDEGVYTGVCTKLVDLGWQYSEQYGKTYHKMMLGWDIAGEKIELGTGEKVNRTMWKEYTLSLNEKAKLRQDLQAWRGKAFTIEELARFNIYQVLGTPCQVQIIHNDRNGKTYGDIGALMALPKGMIAPQEEYPTTFFSFDYGDTYGAFETLPSWIQEKIKKSNDYAESGLKSMVENSTSEYDQTGSDGYFDVDDDEDDLPF